MTRRTLFTRLLGALAAVPLVGKVARIHAGDRIAVTFTATAGPMPQPHFIAKEPMQITGIHWGGNSVTLQPIPLRKGDGITVTLDPLGVKVSTASAGPGNVSASVVREFNAIQERQNKQINDDLARFVHDDRNWPSLL